MSAPTRTGDAGPSGIASAGLPVRRRRTEAVLPGPLPEELPRLSLVADLEAAAARVAALIAPSGYGKSTLMGQLARQARGPVVWLSLTAEAADPLYLAEAVARACRCVAGFQDEPHQQARRRSATAAPLASALARGLDPVPENVLLCFDQTEHLGPAAAAWLGQFVTGLGEGHRCCLAGFDLAPLQFGRLLAQGQVRVMDAGTLAFTLEERRTYLQTRGLAVSAEHAESWPLGLALGTPGSRPLVITPQAYLQDLLATLSGEHRALLDVAAVLDDWSDDGFRAFGVEQADWAGSLLGAGLPLHPLGDGRYRPHTLLREALSQRLARCPDRQRALCLQAAQRAETSGRPLEAIALYRRAGTPERGLALAERYAGALEERWEFGLLRQVLEDLGSAVLPPSLRVKLGLCLLHFGEVVRAESLLRDLQQVPEVRAEALFLLSALASRRGDSRRQLDLARAGLEAAPCDRTRTRLLRVQAAALNVLGQAEQALPVIQAALVLADSSGQLGERAHLLALLNAVHAFTHTPLAEREAVIQAGLRAYQTAGLPQGCTRLHASLAYLYRLQGRLQESWEETTAALRHEEQHPTPDRCLILEAQGDLHLWNGDQALARARYLDSLQAADDQGMTFLQAGLHYKLAEMALAEADHPLMHRHLSQARSWRYEQQASWLAGEVQFFEGLFAAARGDLDDARTAFRAALADPQLSLERQARARVRLLDLAGPGELPAAEVQALCRHLSYLGSAAVLRLDRPALAPLYARIACAAPDPVLVQEVLQADVLPVDLAERRTVLHVQLLDSFQVTVDGQSLRIPNSKSAELLAWLALTGPSDRETLVDALTGGEAEQRHVEYVKISVRRLRAALSEAAGVSFNPLEYQDGRYLLSPHFELSTDVGQVRRALQCADPAEWQAGLDGYRGPLLPRVHSAWAEERRLELHEEVIEGAYRLCAASRVSDPQAAIRACRRILDLDPLQEEAAALLVDLVGTHGSPEEALQTQRHCQRRLLSELRS